MSTKEELILTGVSKYRVNNRFIILDKTGKCGGIKIYYVQSEQSQKPDFFFFFISVR